MAFFQKHESEMHVIECAGCVSVHLSGSCCKALVCALREGERREEGGERRKGEGRRERGLEWDSWLHLLTQIIPLQVNKYLIQC